MDSWDGFNYDGPFVFLTLDNRFGRRFPVRLHLTPTYSNAHSNSGFNANYYTYSNSSTDSDTRSRNAFWPYIRAENAL